MTTAILGPSSSIHKRKRKGTLSPYRIRSNYDSGDVPVIAGIYPSPALPRSQWTRPRKSSTKRTYTFTTTMNTHSTAVYMALTGAQLASKHSTQKLGNMTTLTTLNSKRLVHASILCAITVLYHPRQRHRHTLRFHNTKRRRLRRPQHSRVP